MKIIFFILLSIISGILIFTYVKISQPEIKRELEVKKEINPIRYLIKLGNREIETKSNLPLIVGKKYFAQIKEFKSSSILSCWSMVSVKIMTLFPFSAKYNAGIK